MNGSPYHGPVAVFTDDELRRIKGYLMGAIPPETAIIRKIDCALEAHPKLKEPDGRE